MAGMQAALTAAERGHHVILCERQGQLGGILRCEERVPFKRLLANYLDYQSRMVSRAPIDVRLGLAVTPEYATETGADVIIAALGSRPRVPKIPGVEDGNVLDVEQAYRHPEKTDHRVIILGGGPAGIELAIYLAGLGREVTIMEMMETLSDGGNPVHGLALMNEIHKYGIRVLTATEAVEIAQTGVVGKYVGDAYTLPPSPTVQAAVLQSSSFSKAIRADAEVGSRKLYEADTVVCATGMQSLNAEADTLRFCAPEFHQIGDCLSVTNVHQATRMAFAIARDL